MRSPTPGPEASPSLLSAVPCRQRSAFLPCGGSSTPRAGSLLPFCLSFPHSRTRTGCGITARIRLRAKFSTLMHRRKKTTGFPGHMLFRAYSHRKCLKLLFCSIVPAANCHFFHAKNRSSYDLFNRPTASPLPRGCMLDAPPAATSSFPQHKSALLPPSDGVCILYSVAQERQKRKSKAYPAMPLPCPIKGKAYKKEALQYDQTSDA